MSWQARDKKVFTETTGVKSHEAKFPGYKKNDPAPSKQIFVLGDEDNVRQGYMNHFVFKRFILKWFFSRVSALDVLILCWSNILAGLGSRDKLLVKPRTRDRMVESSNPGRSGGIIFFSRVNFVCWLLFGVRSTSMLRQWHVKDPGHSAKSAGGKLHLHTHTPLTRRSRNGLTMLLSRHSVGTS